MQDNKKQKIIKILLGVILFITCFIMGFIVGNIVRKNVSQNNDNNSIVESSKYNIIYNDGNIPGNTYQIEIDENYDIKVIHQPHCSTVECINGEYYPEKEEYHVKLTKEEKEKLKKIVEKIFKESKANIIDVVSEFKMLTSEENSFFKTIIIRKGLSTSNEIEDKTTFSEDWMNDLLNKYTINNVEYTIVTDKYDEKGAPVFIDKKFVSSEYKIFLTDVFTNLDKKVSKTILAEGIGFEMSSSIHVEYIDDKNVKHELSIIDANENTIAIINWSYDKQGEKDNMTIGYVYDFANTNLFDDVVLKYSK